MMKGNSIGTTVSAIFGSDVDTNSTYYGAYFVTKNHD